MAKLNNNNDAINAEVDDMFEDGNVAIDAELDEFEDTMDESIAEDAEDLEMSILERAKSEGLTVTPDGRIVLPGKKGETKKAPKAKKEKAAPKAKKEKTDKPAYKGLTSNIVTVGLQMMANLAGGLNTIFLALQREGYDGTWKLTTYQYEARLAFQEFPATEFWSKLDQEERDTLTNLGWAIDEGKTHLSIKIATKA